MTLNYDGYTLDFDNMKFTETECKKKGRSYCVPVKARINLELKNSRTGSSSRRRSSSVTSLS